MQHRIFVSDDMEAFLAQLAEEFPGLDHKLALAFEMTNATVPAAKLAVARK